MKKTQRLAALLLVLALLAPGAAWAADENVFSGGTAVIAVPGGEVLFPIEASGGASFAACKLFVLCDTNVFSLEQNHSGAYQVQPGELTRQGTWGANSYGNGGWQISWYRERNVTAQGLLCSMPLKVAADAPLGTYEVTLLCSAENTVDEAGNEVPFTAVSGTIEVVSPAPTLYTGGRPLVSGMVVDLPIYIRNNLGLTGLHLQMESNGQMEVVLDKAGKPVITAGTLLSTGNFLVNTCGTKGAQAMWFNATAIEGDGLLCTVRVRVLADPGETVDVPITYQAQNTLNSQRLPQDLAIDMTQAVAALSPPTVAAQRDAAGERLRITGTLDVSPDLNRDRILPIFAYYRNGQLLEVAAQFGQEEAGRFLFSLPTPPSVGDHQERLTLFLLDPTTFSPLCCQTDIVIEQ